MKTANFFNHDGVFKYFEFGWQYLLYVKFDLKIMNGVFKN